MVTILRHISGLLIGGGMHSTECHSSRERSEHLQSSSSSSLYQACAHSNRTENIEKFHHTARMSTVSWLALRRRRPTSCNVSSTRQHESSRIRASSTEDSLISGEVSYIGWTLSTGFGSESVSRCSDVYTRWLLNTCRPTANPSPAFLVSSPPAIGWPYVVISTSHVWNLLRTEGDHLHTLALQIGTHFLISLETIVLLFHLLSATSKPFSFLSIGYHTQRVWGCINSLLLCGPPP